MPTCKQFQKRNYRRVGDGKQKRRKTGGEAACQFLREQRWRSPRQLLRMATENGVFSQIGGGAAETKREDRYVEAELHRKSSGGAACQYLTYNSEFNVRP
jgi:hypothetical protein